MNKILLIGPLSPPINGVSMCNDKIIQQNLPATKVDYINTANTSFSEELGGFSFRKFWSTFKQYFFLYKICFSNVVYLTIGQTFFGVVKYLPFLLTAKVFKKKTVIHIHGNYLHKEYDKLKGIKKTVFKRAIKLASNGIVLSNKLKQNLTPFFKDKDIFILPNFIDNDIFDIEEKDIENKNFSCLRILYLSNLMTEKGILDLLNSLTNLQEKGIKFEANLAGNIDENIRDKVLSIIDSLTNVNYLGVVSGEQKKGLLLFSNVFVFPTYYQMEGQPISLIEAMGFGNIILTTKHAGIEDIVSEENGIFIKKKSPEDITQKLIMLSKNINTNREISINNFKYIRDQFSEKKFLSSLNQILKK